MAKKVGFGLLGAGLIAPFHAKSIRAASQTCELIAVADTNFEAAQQRAKEFDCKAVKSLDELLATPGVDAVCVLLPNDLHVEPTLKAAAAGKHVLTEKPPALTLKDTDRMIEACDKAGVKLGVVLQCRVRKAIQAMKKAMDQGRFGRLYQADTYMKWFRETTYYHSNPWRSNFRSGAGVTIQHAFHYIDLLQYLAGPVKQVQARMTNLAHGDVQLEDTLNAFLKYRNGAEGVVSASTALWPGQDIRVELYGEKGTAVMAGEKMTVWKFKDERPEDEEIRQLGRASVGTAASGPAAFDFADHRVLIEGFAKAVLGGGEPIVTAGSARPSLEIALAMYQSAAAGGQPVALPVANEASAWAKVPLG